MSPELSAPPKDVSFIFAVPLIVQRIPNAEGVNARLREIILERERQSTGIRKSNSGGWHSDETLLSWPEPEIVTLREWIDGAVRKVSGLAHDPNAGPVDVSYSVSGWANVNRHGDYNVVHHHAGSHWAVVYYVATGVEEPGRQRNGRLEIRDPRPAASFARTPGFKFGRGILIAPKPGMLVLFPAWIEHGVHPFYGTGERISIAVNVEITKFEQRDAAVAGAAAQQEEI